MANERKRTKRNHGRLSLAPADRNFLASRRHFVCLFFFCFCVIDNVASRGTFQGEEVSRSRVYFLNYYSFTTTPWRQKCRVRSSNIWTDPIFFSTFRKIQNGRRGHQMFDEFLLNFFSSSSSFLFARPRVTTPASFHRKKNEKVCRYFCFFSVF